MLAGASADQPAPRSKGDPIAMRAAYTSGHVFSGKLKVPAIESLAARLEGARQT